MAISQNGWDVIDSTEVRDWVLPGVDRVLPLRAGPAGFVLAHLALWFHEKVETIDRIPDDWGYNVRKISGSSEYSNHSSGTAVDLNSTLHPYGRRGTFSWPKRVLIRARLLFYRGVVKWGGDYVNTADEMHWEIIKNMSAVVALYKILVRTPRGRRLRKANPVIE